MCHCTHVFFGFFGVDGRRALSHDAATRCRVCFHHPFISRSKTLAFQDKLKALIGDAPASTTIRACARGKYTAVSQQRPAASPTYLAEVSEVMVAHDLGGRLVHSLDVHVSRHEKVPAVGDNTTTKRKHSLSLNTENFSSAQLGIGRYIPTQDTEIKNMHISK